MLRCYYRKGGKELIDGVGYHTCVKDESLEDELLAGGWSRTTGEPEHEVVDEVVELLRSKAKEKGIKGWQRMGEPKLREALGLNDGDQSESGTVGTE